MQLAQRLPPTILVAAAFSLAGLVAIVFLLLTAPEPLRQRSLTDDPRLPTSSDLRLRPQSSRPLPYRHVAGWEEYPVKGQDASGRVAAFRVLVLPGDQHWQFASDEVVLGPDGNEIDVRVRLESPTIHELLATGTHLICVGAASVEGSVPEEERRAAKRAGKLASWVSSVMPADLALYTLSLGRYTARCDSCTQEDTAPQRRVVLILVAAAHDGVDLRGALRNALSNNPAFPLDLDRYSRFELRRRRS